jgi:hypothetical protein
MSDRGNDSQLSEETEPIIRRKHRELSEESEFSAIRARLRIAFYFRKTNKKTRYDESQRGLKVEAAGIQSRNRKPLNLSSLRRRVFLIGPVSGPYWPPNWTFSGQSFFSLLMTS